jgi:hypothetical protein
MHSLPQRPPRFPPGLFRDSAMVIFGNISILLVNVYIAHMRATEGSRWLLALACCAMTVSIWALYRWWRYVRQALRQWAMLHLAFEEICKVCKAIDAQQDEIDAMTARNEELQKQLDDPG